MEKSHNPHKTSTILPKKGVLSYNHTEILPEGNPVGGGAHNIDALVAEAKSIQMQLSGADLDDVKQYVSRLQDLLDRIPMDDRRGRRSARIISSVIVQAQRQLNRQHTEVILDSSHLLLSAAMQVTLYHSMSTAQQSFYTHIKTKTTYTLPAVASHGGLAGAKAEDVSGEELQERFSILHYHSLSDDEKQELLNKTFGVGAVSASEPLTAEAFAERREELEYLRDALRDMEAYKAYLILSQSTGDVRVTLAKIAYNHSKFDAARTQIDALEHVYATLEEKPGNKTALAALEFAREQLQGSLKKGVMQDALVEDDALSELSMKPALLLLPAVGALWGAFNMPPSNEPKSSGPTP